jgi:hypothetical protein
MNTIIKLIIGAILLIGAVMYVYDESISMSLINHSARQDFITVVNGTVPAFMGLIGLFIVWLELDEIKVRREAKS